MYLLKSLSYDPTKDFAAIAHGLRQRTNGVSVNPDLPVTTIPELIAYGKANPGKLSYAVDGSGGFAIAAARLLNKRGGIGWLRCPTGRAADGTGHDGRIDPGHGELDTSRRRR